MLDGGVSHSCPNVCSFDHMKNLGTKHWNRSTITCHTLPAKRIAESNAPPPSYSVSSVHGIMSAPKLPRFFSLITAETPVPHPSYSVSSVHGIPKLPRIFPLISRSFNPCCIPGSTWGFPKIRGTILGIPIIRTIVYWGLYWGPLILGNYHIFSRWYSQAGAYPVSGALYPQSAISPLSRNSRR